MKQLAAEFTLHRTTVAAHLKQAAVKLRRQGLTDTDVAVALALHQEGWSYKRLGEKFACDAETVRQRLKSAW